MIYSVGRHMPSRYTIALYIDEDDYCPVSEYMFDGTNETDLDVIIGVIQRLAHVGQALLDTNMAEPLEGPICELRKGRHRIMYAEDQRKNGFILLSAFMKASQKTPLVEINKAQRYWQEYLRIGKCQPYDIPLDFDLLNL